MWHRPLAEMLTDVLGAVYMARQDQIAVRTSSIELTLPIEVFLVELEGETTLIADLPVWRWRTIFDQPSSSLSITYETSQT
jgi:hypothetical protein